MCRVLFELLSQLPRDVAGRVQAVAIDGTSSTALLVDANTGKVLAAPKLYNETQGGAAVAAAEVRVRPGRSL